MKSSIPFLKLVKRMACLWVGCLAGFSLQAQMDELPVDFPIGDDSPLYDTWELEQSKNYEVFYESSEIDPGFEIVSFQAPTEAPVELDSLRSRREMVNPPEDVLANKGLWGAVTDTMRDAFMLKEDIGGDPSPTPEARAEERDQQLAALIDLLHRRRVPQYLDKSYLSRATADLADKRRFSPRIEIRELDLRDSLEHGIFNASRGTLGMIASEKLTPIDEFTVQVDTSVIMGQQYGLCRDEPYWTQPSACFCTAFLVDSNIVATAAHCIQYLNLDEIKFILGFELANQKGKVDYKIEGRDIFTATEVIGRSESQPLDFVLLRIDRAASAQKVLKVATLPAAFGDSVYAIGFPSGLPMKVAGIGTVTQKEGNAFFYSNIDTYEGNSGSPVFSAKTHEVVGILIEGDQDFENQGNCRRAKECFGKNCKGEKAISASQVLPFLQHARQEY